MDGGAGNNGAAGAAAGSARERQGAQTTGRSAWAGWHDGGDGDGRRWQHGPKRFQFGIESWWGPGATARARGRAQGGCTGVPLFNSQAPGGDHAQRAQSGGYGRCIDMIGPRSHATFQRPGAAEGRAPNRPENPPEARLPVDTHVPARLLAAKKKAYFLPRPPGLSLPIRLVYKSQTRY